MLLGPIFSFDLVTSARRRRYYLLRTLYACVLAALIWTIFGEHGIRRTQVSIHDAAALAESFFMSMSIVQLLAVLLLGPALAAGTVALERERRTIEYLFVTDLSNSEIVVGKLAARLLHLAFLVAVGLPVMALAMLFGGISPEQLATVFAVTLSTMVAVVALSVAVSVWSPRARDAVVRSYLAVFSLVAIPPFLANVWREIMGYSRGTTAVPWVLEQMREVNPFHVFDLLQTAGTWPSVLKIVLCHLAFAGLCAGLALGAVRRVHLKELGRAPKATRRRRRWRGELGESPMLWKELFADQARLRLGILGRLVIWTIALGYFLMAAWFALRPPENGTRPWEIAAFAGWTTTLLCLGLIMIGARAASSITSEKDRQCWEPLLLTSLTPSEIIGAKILGNLYAARGLALLVSFAWLLQLISHPDYLVVIPFNLATLGLLMLFSSALGVLFSLYSRDSLRAIAMTMTVGIVVGGGYLFCCALLMIPNGPGRGWEIIFAPCMPFLLTFPTIAYVESHQAYVPRQSELTTAYMLGMIGYLVAALVIWGGGVKSLAQTRNAA